MKKVITRKFNNKVEKSETEIEKPAKKRYFGRRRVFIDPANKSMRYDRFDTYAENKQDYYTTLQLVFTGKCKNIFEAYALNR